MFGVDYFNGQDGTNGVDGTNGADGIDAIVDYDSLANLISADSTFTTNVGGEMGGGGCDYQFPQGKSGIPIVYSFSNGDYTVPVGKTLYMSNARNWGEHIIVSGNTIQVGYPNHGNLIFAEGIKIIDNNSNGSFVGLLFNKNTDIIPISHAFVSSYTVPLGKILYITKSSYWASGEVTISGSIIEIGEPNQNGMILSSGTVMMSNGNPSANFNGYLVDENYFAGCGGGGSSSSTSILDSTTIANMIAAASVGNMVFGDYEGPLDMSLTEIIPGVGTAPFDSCTTERQAHSDGFIIGLIRHDSGGDANFGMYIDSLPISSSSLKIWETLTHHHSSFCIPIKKDYYWTINKQDWGGNYPDNVFFIPLESSSSSSNTSSSNSAIGVGSAVDLNDFDKEYNLFDAQISWLEDRFVIDVDEDHNVYLATDYNVNVNENNTIGGQSLYYESGSSDRSIAIAKYDSTGAIQYVQSISLNPAESYEVTDCDLDANGDFLVTGRKFATTNNYYSIFIRKYDNSGNLVFEHVSVPNNGNCVSWKIISDGSGGAYICGVYTEAFDLGNGALLPADNNGRNQGYIARFDQNGNVLWSDYMGVTTHSASGAGWYDQAQSLALDANGNILVAGQIDPINTGTIGHQHFIRKYNSSGTLLDEQLSSNYDSNIPEKNGIRITVDNNGDIYLYTHHPMTQQYPSTHTYSFNGLTLDPINGSSQILYKLSSTLTPIYAKNFGVPGSAYLYQIISLDSDNIVMRPNSNGPYIIDNIIYSQDINQQSVLLELSGNAEFVQYHTLGNNLGSTVPIHIASNSNSTFILYKRDGSFINNSITYPSGYYVVKEQY
tara:strand:+ start:1 stop:2493 length:2493 start_codon:yes stop_codon:yes gene_type:complete